MKKKVIVTIMAIFTSFAHVVKAGASLPQVKMSINNRAQAKNAKFEDFAPGGAYATLKSAFDGSRDLIDNDLYELSRLGWACPAAKPEDLQASPEPRPYPVLARVLVKPAQSGIASAGPLLPGTPDQLAQYSPGILDMKVIFPFPPECDSGIASDDEDCVAAVKEEQFSKEISAGPSMLNGNQVQAAFSSGYNETSSAFVLAVRRNGRFYTYKLSGPATYYGYCWKLPPTDTSGPFDGIGGLWPF